jgi:5-methylcytosine-specific restriction endonuclease McrA
VSGSIASGSAKKRRKRQKLHAQAGGRCVYCGTQAGLEQGTMDHYVPRALGGVSAEANLRWSCRDCNERKGRFAPEEWEKWLVILRAVQKENRTQ